MNEENESPTVSDPVEPVVRCISDIIDNFKETGEVTPAHGVSYTNKANDMCATIYDHGRKAKVYSDRKEGSEHLDMFPCHYNHCDVIYT